MSFLRTFALGAVLALPAAIPYVVHALPGAGGRGPSGFIIMDMAGYMAKARQYADDGLGWAYANPSDPDPESPRIYFQPWSLALGLIHHATGWDVGLIFVGFGLVSVPLCAWAIVRLYREVVGLSGFEERAGLVAFFWGGGLLAAAGLARALLRPLPMTWENIFAFDPGKGWWFLNLGRNLLYPTEAFYHFLFLSCILATLRRRFLSATLLALFLSACHPFSGLELSLALLGWLGVEFAFMKNRERVGGLLVGMVAVLAATLGYYEVYLGRFPEHRLILAQMALDWSLYALSFVPAYAIVAALALWRLRTLEVARATLSAPRNRLFLAWAAVASTLANHDFAIAPRQPLHFTRGYVWTPLFLLGAPALIGGFRALRARLPGPIGGAAVAMTVALIVSDNAAWIATFPSTYLADRTFPEKDVRFTVEEWAVLDALDDPRVRGHVVLSEDPDLGYLAIVYSPLRSWAAQYYETPDAEQSRRELDDLFEEGAFLPEWEARPLVVIERVGDADDPIPAWLAVRDAELVLENGSYRVHRIGPGGR